VRAALAEIELEAAVGIDPNGAAHWIPFDDGPHYEPLRMWLQDLADATIAARPDIFTHGHGPNRIRIDVGSNATGRFSAWPYSVRGNAALTMLAPVPWANLEGAAPATLQTPPIEP
jgi:DNA primase